MGNYFVGSLFAKGKEAIFSRHFAWWYSGEGTEVTKKKAQRTNSQN